jgi:hypothetical protein
VILLKSFDDPVIFNKIPRANNCADGHAKRARVQNLPFIQINDAHQSPHQHQIFDHHAPDTTYPRRSINDYHQHNVKNYINETLHKVWRGRLNSEIDCDLTLQVPSTGLDRTNFLDANLYQVQTHVINTVFRNIQTMEKRITFNDNLFEDSYSLMCEDATIEDQDHACFALAQKQDIFNNVKALALKDLSKPNSMVSASTVKRAFASHNLTPNSILENPLTKGLITKRNMRRGI